MTRKYKHRKTRLLPREWLALRSRVRRFSRAQILRAASLDNPAAWRRRMNFEPFVRELAIRHGRALP